MQPDNINIILIVFKGAVSLATPNFANFAALKIIRQ